MRSSAGRLAAGSTFRPVARSTMRELIVLRHAKSSWDDIDKRDHDRRLASRGIEAAKRMGAVIQQRGWVPDRIICSTAARTQQTLELAREGWPTTSPIDTVTIAALYLASPLRLFEIIREQPDEARRLLVVGHNPGLHGFLTRLVGHGDKADLADLSVKFPTAGLAAVALDIDTWQGLTWSAGRLLGYEFPKKCGLTSE
jgi:phosphohistidine phosphatase